MASSASHSTDLVLQSSSGMARPLARGESTHVAARSGEHYRVQSLSAKGGVKLEDDVVAIRRGDDLALRYGDGSEVVLDRFFIECVRGQCAVEVAGGTGGSQWISGDSVAGASNADGAALLYAHGDQDAIGSVLQAEGFGAGSSSAPGHLAGLEIADGEASYLPTTQAAGGAGSLGTPAAIGLGALALGGLALAAGGGGSDSSSPSAGNNPAGDSNPGEGNNPGGDNNPDGSANPGDNPGDGLNNNGGTDPGTPSGGNPPAVTTVEGSVVAGPVIAGHGLTVAIYGATGTLLGTGTVDASGHYSIPLADRYSGALLVRVQDSTAAADYRDEGTNTDRDLSIDLRAFSVLAGETLALVNVNLLTELAVRSAGLAGGDAGASVVSLSSLDTATITASNQSVARAFGLDGGLANGAAPVAVITAAGAADPTTNDYGRILAALSGAEDNGNTDGVLTMLLAGLDNGALSSAAIAAVVAGAAVADAATGTTGLGSLVAALLNAQAGGGEPPAAPAALSQYIDDVEGITTSFDAPSTAALTNDARPSFLVEAGLTTNPVLIVDNVVVASTYLASPGTLTPTEALSDGTHAIRWAKVTADLQGESSPAFDLTIDATAPAALPAITNMFVDMGGYSMSMSMGLQLATSQPTFAVTMATSPIETDATLLLYIDGERVDMNATTAAITWSLTPTVELTPGAHTVAWAQQDAAGNISALSEPGAFTVMPAPLSFAPALGDSMEPQLMSLSPGDVIGLADLTSAADAPAGQLTSSAASADIGATLSQQTWQGLLQGLEQPNSGLV